MADSWYYLQEGQKVGPDELPKLQELIATGKLGPDDVVWTKGMANWAAASTVTELFPPGSVPPPLDLEEVARPRVRRTRPVAPPSQPSEALATAWNFLNGLHLNRRVVFWTALSGAFMTILPWFPLAGTNGIALMTGMLAHLALMGAAGLSLLGRRDRPLAGTDQIVVAVLAGFAAVLCVVDLIRLSETRGVISTRPGIGVFLTLAVSVVTIILVYVIRGTRSDEDRI